jgi:hypothetical protein
MFFKDKVLTGALVRSEPRKKTKLINIMTMLYMAWPALYEVDTALSGAVPYALSKLCAGSKVYATLHQ